VSFQSSAIFSQFCRISPMKETARRGLSSAFSLEAENQMDSPAGVRAYRAVAAVGRTFCETRSLRLSEMSFDQMIQSERSRTSHKER
jgi:hypothetical protein